MAVRSATKAARSPPRKLVGRSWRTGHHGPGGRVAPEDRTRGPRGSDRGQGAGRAVLKFTASFKDSEGQLLAEFEGGKSYHGVELVDNPTFKSDESTNLGLISYSISQIGNFLEKNGEL